MFTSTIKNTTSCLLLAIVLSIPAVAQVHREVPDQPYLAPAVTATPQIAPAFKISSANFLSVQVNVDANGNNILNDAANEPSIAVSPVDPSRMAIGWRQFDNIQSSFRQAGFGYSTNGGSTWTFPGVIEPGLFRSDPVLACDAQGRFYYNSLAVVNGSEFSCDVFRTDQLGSWDEGRYAIGGDKQWMVIDTTSGPGSGHVYEHWTSFYTACTEEGNFSRSTDAGESYEDCNYIQPEVYWGTCAVGPDGKLYISGANDQLARSSNAQLSNESVIWDEGVYINLGGDIPENWNNQDPNPAGLKAQRWVAVNHAPGPLHGQVYLLQSVRPADFSDPAEVMFSRSTDGGATWSTPVRVNDDSGAPSWQWFGTMSVAPNGRIDAVWLDTRDNPGTIQSSLYYAYSTDGGLTWSANERLSPAFDPHLGWPQQQKIGDYYHMVSDNAGAHLAWSATFNGEQDVYYGRITLPNSGATEHAAVRVQSVQPNPFKDQTVIEFETLVSETVRVQIFNPNGTLVREMRPETAQAGTQRVVWDGRDSAGGLLPNGVYFCHWPNSGQFAKVVLMR